jgi:hypothetical protein
MWIANVRVTEVNYFICKLLLILLIKKQLKTSYFDFFFLKGSEIAIAISPCSGF